MFASPSNRERRAFLREESATTAVEYALLAPVFFGLIFMIAQIGLYFYCSASLSNATNVAARKIFTGAVANTQNMSASVFRNNVLCPLLPGGMSCNNIIVNAVVVPSTGNFSGIPAPAMNNSQTSFCIGQPGSYVILQVYYAMPIIGFPLFLSSNRSTYNGQPVAFINANAVFVNEPFTTSYSGC